MIVARVNDCKRVAVEFKCATALIRGMMKRALASALCWARPPQADRPLLLGAGLTTPPSARPLVGRGSHDPALCQTEGLRVRYDHGA
jgi:hypothetical protein